MYFDRMDICEAYFVYAMLYHEGMGSKEYAIFATLERLGFKASPFLNDEDSLTENGREIFDQLVSGEREVRDRT